MAAYEQEADVLLKGVELPAQVNSARSSVMQSNPTPTRTRAEPLCKFERPVARRWT